ncbi:MAG: hypothetical protein V4510_11820 [bacterium]
MRVWTLILTLALLAPAAEATLAVHVASLGTIPFDEKTRTTIPVQVDIPCADFASVSFAGGFLLEVTASGGGVSFSNAATAVDPTPCQAPTLAASLNITVPLVTYATIWSPGSHPSDAAFQAVLERSSKAAMDEGVTMQSIVVAPMVVGRVDSGSASSTLGIRVSIGLHNDGNVPIEFRLAASSDLGDVTLPGIVLVGAKPWGQYADASATVAWTAPPQKWSSATITIRATPVAQPDGSVIGPVVVSTVVITNSQSAPGMQPGLVVLAVAAAGFVLRRGRRPKADLSRPSP